MNILLSARRSRHEAADRMAAVGVIDAADVVEVCKAGEAEQGGSRAARR